ncbi:MAG: endonuclease domain-containing protein [Candidatus Altimarinota bacterium]
MKERRKELRYSPTNAEDKLWKHLQKKQLNGLIFRRQHGIGPYVADFYHALSRTVIEIDGSVHLTPEVREKDQWREAFLKEHGYNSIRFSNQEVFHDIGDVLSRIVSSVDSVKQLPPCKGARGLTCEA